ncbi:glycosyltransferase, partial [Candidatus Woesearchaeota archaeon]|nr:glycosyltransferase [Candidatus Woesearchaeota archaeon]
GSIDISVKNKFNDDELNMTVTGHINHDEVYNYIDVMDIAVMPDICSYASPMKVIEYMALSKPVIGANVPGTAELISKETGILITPNSSEELKDALKILINNSELRMSLGNNAKKFILDGKYTWKNNAKRVIEIYEELKSKNNSNK